MNKLQNIFAGAALLGMSAMPTLAQSYSKQIDDRTDEATVEQTQNGARLEMRVPDCNLLESRVEAAATRLGVEAGSTTCASGTAWSEMYGEPAATTAALSSVVEQSMNEPSVALTPAEVANERAMVDAVKGRLLVSTPDNFTNPWYAKLMSGAGNNVLGAVNLAQHWITGADMTSPEGGIMVLVEYVPIHKRTGEYVVGVRLSTIAAASDIIDPATQPFYKVQVCLQNGGDNPCVDNTTTGPKTDTRVAQSNWSNALVNTHAGAGNGRDRLTKDDLGLFVIADKVCENVISGSTACYNTINAITRDQAADTYLGKLTCVNSASCGTAVIQYRSHYDGTAMLDDTSEAELLMSHPDWTFAKEMIETYKRPRGSLQGWVLTTGMSTLGISAGGNTTLTHTQYSQLLAPPNVSLTHRGPQP